VVEHNKGIPSEGEPHCVPIYVGSYEQVLLISARVSEAKAAGERVLVASPPSTQPWFAVRKAAHEPGGRHQKGSIRRFTIGKFANYRGEESLWKCGEHGKQRCTERVMVEVAVAMCADLERFRDVLAHVSVNDTPLQETVEGEEEPATRQSVDILPPHPGPTSYDSRMRVATLLYLTHTTADNPTHVQYVSHNADGLGVHVSLWNLSHNLSENWRVAIRNARLKGLNNATWLFGCRTEEQRSSLQCENRPEFIWKRAAEEESHLAANCAGSSLPERHPSPQWIESSNGSLQPFHPPWQHSTRHEPGLLQAGLLESAMGELKRREDSCGRDNDWGSAARNHKADSTLGSIALDAYRGLDRALELSGKVEVERICHLRVLPKTPSLETFEQALPLAIYSASIASVCLCALRVGDVLTLQQMVEELVRKDLVITAEALAPLLYLSCQWGLVHECSNGAYSMAPLPASFPDISLLFVLKVDLAFRMRRCCSIHSVEAFFELLAISWNLEGFAGSACTEQTKELAAASPAPAHKVCNLSVTAVRITSLWPDRLLSLASPVESTCEGSWSFETAMLVRSVASQDNDSQLPVGVPRWFAARCLATYSSALEMLTLSYVVPGVQAAVPGLLKTIWLATAEGVHATRVGSVIVLPGPGGLRLKLWVFNPTSQAFKHFWARVQQLNIVLGRPPPPAIEDVNELACESASTLQTLQESPEMLNAQMSQACGAKQSAWLMTTMGSAALVQAVLVGDAPVAQVVAVYTTGKSGECSVLPGKGSELMTCGSRTPQVGEPPRVVRCSLVDSKMLALRLWMPTRSAALPPQVEEVVFEVHDQDLSHVTAFARGVQGALEWPGPNIRPAVSPPPPSGPERRMVEAARAAFGPLHMVASFVLKRLILIFDKDAAIRGPPGLGLPSASRSSRILLEHQRCILQPAPVSAFSLQSQLMEGGHEVLAGLPARTGGVTPKRPVSTQQLGCLAADIPFHFGGGSPAAISRILRSYGSYEALAPSEVLDELAFTALVPLPGPCSPAAALSEACLSASPPTPNGGGKEAGDGRGGLDGEAPPVTICVDSDKVSSCAPGEQELESGMDASQQRLPVSPSTLLLKTVPPSILKSSQTQCALCGGQLKELPTAKVSFLITPYSLTYVDVVHKRCQNRECCAPCVPKDLRDTCGLVCAHLVCYPQETQVRPVRPQQEQLQQPTHTPTLSPPHTYIVHIKGTALPSHSPAHPPTSETSPHTPHHTLLTCIARTLAGALQASIPDEERSCHGLR